MLSAKQYFCGIVERFSASATRMFHRIRIAHWAGTASNFYGLALLPCLLIVPGNEVHTYTIKTLDGTDTTISMQDNTSAASTSAPLTISCSTDKLVVAGYWAGGEVRVLNKKFLCVRYFKRGGSDLGIGNTLVLCIKRGKLRQVMHIESYLSDIQLAAGVSYEYRGRKIADARLLLDANNTAHLTFYDSLLYARKITASSRRYTVKYNSNQQVFANYQQKISVPVYKFNHKMNRSERQRFVGTAPAFRLGSDEYVFIAGCWYLKSTTEIGYFSLD